MNRVLVTFVLAMFGLLAQNAHNVLYAKDYIIKEISDTNQANPFFFKPSELKINVGDSVTFINDQDDTHDVIFTQVPKALSKAIMSGMMTKKGEKFTYNFTIPGTYKFHCHPHESFHMAGSIVVGKPSKPEEVFKISHQGINMGSMSESSSPLKKVQTSSIVVKGTVLQVGIKERILVVDHQPIADIGWPSMVMEFDLEHSVDTQAIKIGDIIEFTLIEVQRDVYSIDKILKVN